jgi:hypothetical protein
MLPQLHDLVIVAVWTERRGVGTPLDDAESEHTLVEQERALEIRDLEADPAKPCLLGQPVVPRTDSVHAVARTFLPWRK